MRGTNYNQPTDQPINPSTPATIYLPLWAARPRISKYTKTLLPNELQHDRHQRYDFQRKSQLRAADTQNKLHRRPTNYNADSTGNTAMAKTTAPRHPPRTNMRTKGRATVQTTTRATAASPDARRRHVPYIAPTAAPAQGPVHCPAARRRSRHI